MAIVSVTRRWHGETADRNSEVHHYRVVVDDINTTCTQARAAVDPGTSLAIPAEYSVLAGTTWQAHVTAERLKEDPLVFDVTVTFRAPDRSTLGFETKPEGGGKWNKRVRGRGIVFEEETFVDDDDVEVANSARQRFTHGLLTQLYDEEFIVEFDTDSYDLDALALCRGKVNDAPVTLTVKGVSRTFAAQTLRLLDGVWDFTWQYATDPNAPDLSISLQFIYRPNGWKARKVDEGFYRLAADEGDGDVFLEPIKDADGEDITTPVYLDGNGQPLPPGDDVVLLEFTNVKVASFAGILAGV